jgi:serine/threonine protein kinase
MERTASCPSCRRGIFAEDAFCSWCGSAVQARDARTGESRRSLARETIPTGDRLTCGSCHSFVLPGDLFCSTCGARHAGEDAGTAFGDAWAAIPHRVAEASRGKFTFIRELGRGGMGIVFLARDEELERLVAIKVLSPTWLTDEAMVQRFQREARTIARLRHESIITVYDEGRAGDLSYFVMDYIEGVSLSRILRVHGALPIAVVEAILYRVGSALDYAHRPGRAIVHRDVKPSNIMLDSEGLVVVMDFGISKASERPSGLTSTGLVMGTPEYMSPEQCRGHTVTHESDQYSLGAVIFAMLTGAPPFTGPFYQVLMAHQTEPVPSIVEARPDCPPELAAAIERMLAKLPGERWGSIGEALRSLSLRPLAHDDPVMVELGRMVRATENAASRGHGRDSDSHTRRTPTSIRIVPHPEDLEVGDELSLVATILFPDGVEETGREVSWQSTNPGIARVDPTTGQLVAVGAGSALITASGGGLEESVSVDVRPPQVARLAIEPSDPEVRVGETVRLSASPRSKHGQPLEHPVAWSSSDPRTVWVSPEGVVTARREGSATVLAHCGGVGTATSVRVTPAAGEQDESRVVLIRISDPPEGLRASETFRLVATPLDDVGRPLGDPVTWQVEDPQLVEDLGGGRFRALRAGRAGIVAESEGVRMRVYVPVAERAASTAAPGWEASGPAAGAAANRGVAMEDRGVSMVGTGQDAGTASVGGPRRSKALLVAGPVLLVAAIAAFALTRGGDSPPETPTVRDVVLRVDGADPPSGGLRITAGERLPLSAAALDAAGDPLDRPVEWTSSDPAVASIDGAGMLVALAAGAVRVSASADGVVSDLDVEVLARIAGVVVRRGPDGATVESGLDLDVGETVTLTAAVTGPEGRELEGEAVAWQSSDGGVASVDDAGRVAGRAPGRAVLTATAGEVGFDVPVTVTRREVAPPPPPAEGTLRLIVRPWAYVFVDGQQRGEGDERDLSVRLAPGSHRLRLDNPNMAPFDTTIVIQSGRVLTLTKQLVRREQP